MSQGMSAGTAILQQALIAKCKQRKFASKMADSLGTEVTGGQLLMRALILRRLLRREALQDDEKCVGLLLPPSVGGAITNVALGLDRRVAVNLNYTVTSEVLNDCLAQAGIRHVLTTRKFMQKMSFDLNAEVVYLDDFRDRVRLSDKLAGVMGAYVTPTRRLIKKLGLHEIKRDDLLTIIFTSGSTGQPKGVMLSVGNIAHNVDAIEEVVHLKSDDVLLGILPFFHAFGFTVTLWAVLSLDIKGVYHFNPLEAGQVGKLARKEQATILLSTPTFLRNYLRRIPAEDFASLDVVVAGAEKLPADLIDSFANKFGVRPVEGYGATELSPLVAANIPRSRSVDPNRDDVREGTVGRPVPRVQARVVDLETGQVLPTGEQGMLQISGPNVMQGYLNLPEATAAVLKDGWYTTGDLAVIDSDGFIQITGRLSRFSKIGGEMVPHIKVEEALLQIVGGDEGACHVAVTAVPDEKKGERLVVLHTPIEQRPDQLCKALLDAGLPKIAVPAANQFYEVAEIPVLGTGKLDLRAIRELAEQLVHGAGAPNSLSE